MAATFPGGIKSFTTRVNGDTIDASHVNDLQDEVAAIETDLFSGLTNTLKPISNDGAALGTSALAWSDLFLASGGVLNFANGDVTITHSANALAFAGASSGYTFDSSATFTGLLTVNGGASISGGAFTASAGTNNFRLTGGNASTRFFPAIAGTRTISGMTEVGGLFFTHTDTYQGISGVEWHTDSATAASANSKLVFYVRDGGTQKGLTLDGSASTPLLTWAGAATFTGTLGWGGGSAISSSSNVTLLNAANVFTTNQQLTSEANAYIGFSDTTDGVAGYIGPAQQIMTGGTIDRLGFYGVSGFDWSPDAGGTVKMSLSGDGILSVNGFGTHTFSAGGTGSNRVDIRNTTAGTGNLSMLRLGNDAAVNVLELAALSSTYTTAGQFVASGVAVNATGVGGLSLAAESASGDVRIYSRNALAATFGASQAATFTGTVGSTGLGTHSFSAGGNSGNQIIITNTTSDTAAYSMLRVQTTGGTANYGSIFAFSSGYTTSGTSIASSVLLIGEGAGGLSLSASHASGDVRIYSRSALAATFGASQAATFTGDITVNGTGTSAFSSSSLTVAQQQVGTTRIQIVNNQANVGSHAKLLIGTEAGGGDAYVQFNVGGGGGDWYYGLDNSASDALVWSRTGIGSSDLMSLSTAGLLTVSAGLTTGTGNDGTVRVRGIQWTDVASQMVLAWATNNGRIVVQGSDTSTNASFSVFSTRSNGTNLTTLLDISATGNVTVSGGASITGGSANFFGDTGVSKTGGGGTIGNYLLKSTGDGSNYAALKLSFTGNASAASRVFSMQTIEQGVANAGIIEFQPYGGTVLFSGDVSLAATKKLYLDGGSDTYIYEEAANRFVAIAGGNTVLYMDGNTDFRAPGVYNSTTASAANVFVASNGRMSRSTSSLRYKHDIETLDTTHALSAILAMRPVTYRGKTDEDQRRYVGFIAEEVAEIAPLLATYDEGGETGTPNYVTYDRVTAYLVAVVKQQQADIDALKAQLHERS